MLDSQGEIHDKDGELDESKAIVLEENHFTLAYFLAALLPSQWTPVKVPVSFVIQLLRMSDKYQAPNVRYYIPSMVQFSAGRWSFSEIVWVHHYGVLLKLAYLKDVALRQFLNLGQLEDWEMDNTIGPLHAPLGLVELIQRKQRWAKLWKSTLTYPGKETCTSTSNGGCQSAWERRAREMILGAGQSASSSSASSSSTSRGLCLSHAKQLLDHSQAMIKQLNSGSI